ncbi:MAG: Nickel-cobalt-cadmium resistance protein [Devosia sp.]|uniref:methyltransferase family protein n=1 Tax=Devosia sp. TaxID=1871048 RepID=UPI002623DA75|nr:isoprenylcysteine carboxylmethyltransferase family protein [Devosia sp.]MDB5539492.1 Nickel-cobalt-cadmium resistance protein [Devosia sp.]
MQILLDAIISALGIAIVAQYTWSLRAHFASAKVPPGTMLISAVVILSLASYLYLQWTVEQPMLAKAAGIVLMAGSLGLFWAAIFASREARLLLAFDEKKPHGLISIGPYKHVRHPFYLSYLTFWTGWTLATWHPLGLVPLAVIGCIYVTAALGEERKFENSPLADEYRNYRKRAGFLWPKFNG